jgi:hypothetical protein
MFIHLNPFGGAGEIPMTTEMEFKMSTQDTDFQFMFTKDLPPTPNRATVSRTERARELAQQENKNPAMGTELVATAQF